MDYLRRALRMKSETPVPSKPPLTEEEVFNIVDDYRIRDLPSPTNQQIAVILGRNIEEVNVIRPPGPSLPTYYDGDDDGTPLYNDPERQQIIDNFLKETSGKAKGLETDDGAIFKARNAYDHVRQGQSTTLQQKINTARLPLNQDPKLRFVGRTTDGGRKNHKTISNKNKKKHKKLSRRRRHPSKKNRKSMKRK